MDSQQLTTKVTQLESRVATLEDEGKIIRGEVKAILTEIRSAILVRDNPFDAPPTPSGGPTKIVVAPPEQVAKVELVMPAHEQVERHTEPKHEPVPAPPSVQSPQANEPVPIRPPSVAPATQAPPSPAAPSAPKQNWSLLTIAGLSAWAEEAMRRLGSLRLEILLDLLEAAGHLPSDARGALARVIEMDIPEPERAPSTNETVVILRQLDSLIGDEDDEMYSPIRMPGRP